MYLQVIYWLNAGMDKYEIRRQKLLELLQTHCEGKRYILAEKLGCDASYVSRMLYPEGKPGKKNIGDDMVDAVAKAFGVDMRSLPSSEATQLHRLNMDEVALLTLYRTTDKDGQEKILRTAESMPRSSAVVIIHNKS
jgi:hypothetical protein